MFRIPFGAVVSLVQHPAAHTSTGTSAAGVPSGNSARSCHRYVNSHFTQDCRAKLLNYFNQVLLHVIVVFINKVAV